jgi:hypothetical protein
LCTLVSTTDLQFRGSVPAQMFYAHLKRGRSYLCTSYEAIGKGGRILQTSLRVADPISAPAVARENMLRPFDPDFGT